MTKNNVIIVSHCRDETIYFYDEIDRSSLVILVTKPNSQRDFEIFNNFIIETGCRYVQLDEIDTFDITFELSTHSKEILYNIIRYNPTQVVTQAKATLDSDSVSRKVYEYVSNLQTNKHYIPKFNLNYNKLLARGVSKYMKLYANGDKTKYDMMVNTYRSVEEMKKV